MDPGTDNYWIWAMSLTYCRGRYKIEPPIQSEINWIDDFEPVSGRSATPPGSHLGNLWLVKSFPYVADFQFLAIFTIFTNLVSNLEFEWIEFVAPLKCVFFAAFTFISVAFFIA